MNSSNILVRFLIKCPIPSCVGFEKACQGLAAVNRHQVVSHMIFKLLVNIFQQSILEYSEFG